MPVYIRGKGVLWQSCTGSYPEANAIWIRSHCFISLSIDSQLLNLQALHLALALENILPNGTVPLARNCPP